MLAACVLALLVHAGLSLVRPELAPAQAPRVASQFETLIPVELPEELKELKELEAPEPEATPNPQPTTTHAHRLAPAPKDAPTGDAQALNEEAGPSSDELAAPIATADFGSDGWAILSGEGNALRGGVLGRPGRGEGARPTSTTVKARNLSRDAKPPHLDPLVQRNFPAAAKLARVSGTVTVSAIINERGRPTDVRVVQVTPHGRGFGETCSRTVLEGPDWKPRLNRHGRPVAAKVQYKCDFRAPKGLPQDVDAPTSGAGANRIWTKPAGG